MHLSKLPCPSNPLPTALLPEFNDIRHITHAVIQCLGHWYSIKHKKIPLAFPSVDFKSERNWFYGETILHFRVCFGNKLHKFPHKTLAFANNVLLVLVLSSPIYFTLSHQEVLREEGDQMPTTCHWCQESSTTHLISKRNPKGNILYFPLIARFYLLGFYSETFTYILKSPLAYSSPNFVLFDLKLF